MSEEKTLGQILYEAQWPKSSYGAVDKTSYIREAAGIAAVARHVASEMLAAHVAECHTPRPRLPNEIPPSVDPPQPEAGDWANKVVDSGWRTGCELEKKIRDAVAELVAEVERLTDDNKQLQENYEMAKRIIHSAGGISRECLP